MFISVSLVFSCLFSLLFVCLLPPVVDLSGDEKENRRPITLPDRLGFFLRLLRLLHLPQEPLYLPTRMNS